MPLTDEEMTKLSKALFYADGMTFVTGQWMIDKTIVFRIINDYSPNCKAKLTRRKDGLQTLDMEHIDNPM